MITISKDINILFKKHLDFTNESKKEIYLYHYSNKDVSYLSPNNFAINPYSKSEKESWNQKRVFFYTQKNGYLYDKGNIPTQFKYIVKINLSKLYPIHQNPLEFNNNKLNYDKIKKEAEKQGYIGFIYSWDKENYSNPIVVIWKDIDYHKKYKQIGNEYVEYNDNKLKQKIVGYVINNVTQRTHEVFELGNNNDNKFKTLYFRNHNSELISFYKNKFNSNIYDLKLY